MALLLQVLDLRNSYAASSEFEAYFGSLSSATALTELNLSGMNIDLGPERFRLPPNVVKVNLVGAHAVAGFDLLTQSQWQGEIMLQQHTD